jgi:1-acyl-sn-glycerol-3-phosphate acyltransferase
VTVVALVRLQSPSDRFQRSRATARAVPIVTFLFATLLVFNLAQTASVLLRPFSRRAFRRFNRWAADTWWGWCVLASRHLMDTRPVVTGDPVPPSENAVVVANHQDMPDITFLMDLARQKGRLGDLKWFVKRPLMFVPGVGWGMVFLDCLFVRRDWAADAGSIAATFARLRSDQVPLWLISFVEGTRITPAKRDRSRAFAASQGRRPLDRVQLPRTKGFVASVHGLRDHLDAVYDVTIAYPDGVPDLWQPRAHLHVRRWPIAALPTAAGDLATWLLDRFEEKDELLAHFAAEGEFPRDAVLPTAPPAAVA